MNSYTFKDFYKDLMDIVFLNFIFLVVVLLGAFITFGAAFKALIFVSFRIIDRKKQNYVFKSFIKSFKEEFIKSTLIWLIIGGIGYLLFNIWNYAITNENTIMIISCLVSFYMLITYTLYLFSVIAIFQTQSTYSLLKNTLIIASSHFFTSLKMLAGLIIVIGLFNLFSGTILFSIGFFGVLTAYHLQKVFKPYMKPFEEPEEEM